MVKSCKICSKDFQTKDSRQKTCSKLCANESRKIWVKSNSGGSANIVTVRPIVSMRQLPDPEDLPAPYAKRVSDMWLSLVGQDEYTTRIA